MEAELFAERAALRCLARQHPDWTQAELAATLGRSRSWVAKWLTCLSVAAPNDVTVLHSRSCARHTPPLSTSQAAVERILAIRDDPPDHLRRVPGPKAILYYLPRDAQAQALWVALPRSTRTIWKILRAHGRIAPDRPRRRQPLVRPALLEEVQMDFTDASTVPADPDGKQQHVVEVLNVVDAGTSSLLSAQVNADFHAETAFDAVVTFLQQYGRPKQLTFDRDPRWVGSARGRDFPSALVRFLLCLGSSPTFARPGSLKRPHTLKGIIARLAKNAWRCCGLGQQGRCARPPTLSSSTTTWSARTRPSPVATAHPVWRTPTCPPCLRYQRRWTGDAWLAHIHGQAFARRIQRERNRGGGTPGLLHQAHARRAAGGAARQRPGADV